MGANSKLVSEVTYQLFEGDPQVPHEKVGEKLSENGSSNSKSPYKIRLVWRNIILLTLIHGMAIHGLTLLPYAKFGTFWWIFLLNTLGTLGVQTGAHRLWCHRSFKANFGLRLFLSMCHVMSLQNDLYVWCRDHRAHHKFADTDADPHNSTRGFFFSHVGWLMVRKHPEVARRGKTIDLSDLRADPIVMFQRQFYIPLVLLFWGFLPAWVPYYCWNEDPWFAFIGCVMMRYVIQLNITWLVNSWAHLYGTRPYDQNAPAVECSIRSILLGEGFHNYHHTFPWDYSASELGPLDVFNPGTASINFFHYMGWAWDLKRADPNLIKKRIQATGDLTVQYEKGQGRREWLRGCAFVFVFYMAFVAIHYGFKP